jgi:hypothetical protein
MPQAFTSMIPKPEETMGLPNFAELSKGNFLGALPGASLFGIGGGDDKVKFKVPKLGNLKFNPTVNEDLFKNLNFGYPEINSLYTRPITTKTIKVSGEGQARRQYNKAMNLINDYFATSGIAPSGQIGKPNIPNFPNPNNTGTAGLPFSKQLGLNLNPSFMSQFSSFLPSF